MFRLVAWLFSAAFFFAGIAQPLLADERARSAVSSLAYATPAPPLPSEGPVRASPALIFSAPPRETIEEGNRIYQSIAAYLSQATGRRIVYQHPGNWGVYRTQMVKGAYDLVFDGPHFNSYRMEQLNHRILLKLPGTFQYAVILREDRHFISMTHMRGHTFCAAAPPNLGTLMLLRLFDNPTRQPVIVAADTWEQVYQGVVSGRCVGGVLPLAALRKYDPEGTKTRIVYNTTEVPNQALSAGPRVSTEDRANIIKALILPEAAGPTANLHAVWKTNGHFSIANHEQYAGLSEYLQNAWGFY